MQVNNEMKKWADAVWEKLDKKLSKATLSARDILPYEVKDGSYMERGNTSWWTNGFWGALNWIMYAGTQNEEYKRTAKRSEAILDQALDAFVDIHHDVGFMWRMTGGFSYQLTGDEESRLRLFKAANYLAARFNIR